MKLKTIKMLGEVLITLFLRELVETIMSIYQPQISFQELSYHQMGQKHH